MNNEKIIGCIIHHSGIYKNIGYDVRIDDDQLTLDAEDGRKVYRVMFCDDLYVHKYTTDATTGEILSEMVKSIDSYYG